MSNAAQPRHSLHPAKGGWKAIALPRSGFPLFQPQFHASGAGEEAKYLDCTLEALILGGESLPREWHSYLERLPDANGRLARELWRMLRAAFAQVAVPQAGPVPEGGFQFVWDEGEHHLEIDILADRTIEWFYRNRRTNDVVGDDGIHEIPAAFYERLHLFSRRP
jgi:hypothetical protein